MQLYEKLRMLMTSFKQNLNFTDANLSQKWEKIMIEQELGFNQDILKSNLAYALSHLKQCSQLSRPFEYLFTIN